MATVTIAKSYFDALLRRGEFHTDGADVLPSHDGVTISQAEYAVLIKQAREYAILRDALLRGGLDQSTLDLLISGANAPHEADGASSWDPSTAFVQPTSVPVSITRPPSYSRTPDPSEQPNGFTNGYVNPTLQCAQGCGHRSYSFGALESNGSFVEKDDGFMADHEGNAGNAGNARNGNMTNSEQRTLLITNLPEHTTHAELMPLISGGALLDIYLRDNRTATLSFVSGARDFLAHAKRTDMYLRTKRLEFRWNDRQFRLPTHVANKISQSATRNLVIRGAATAGKGIDEQRVRDDLEHIDKLVVISMRTEPKTGDVFLSTNSVHNALFARTCMMSRALYKGLKIEHYPDECAVPVPKAPERAPLRSINPPNVRTVSGAGSRKASVPVVKGNLYALLAEDGTTEGSDDESLEEGEVDEHEESAFPGYEDSGVKIQWADGVVVA